MAETKKEIFTYNAPWELYGMSWSVRPDKKFRLAIGSFIEEYSNKVQVALPLLTTFPPFPARRRERSDPDRDVDRNSMTGAAIE
eukprot:1031690-Rhodomonas_salina.2